jgi:alkaline phosphatase D
MATLSRRQFSLALASMGGRWALPAVASVPSVTIGSRPRVTHGVASGDVEASSAVVWSRCDQTARMVVEWSEDEGFGTRRHRVGPVAGPEADFTAKLLLQDLPPGRRIFYRVGFEDRQGVAGDWEIGSLVTAATRRERPSEVHFVWSGDTCGQGYGIDESRGGMLTYRSMLAQEPQFFVHSGDTIYADNALPAEMRLPDGTLWKNRVTEEKSKVAESLTEFRGNYRYNLLDAHVRRFNARVPMFAQWDDHEVLNNWYPGELLPVSAGYRVRDVNLLAARSRQAFFESLPIRNHPERQVYRRIRRGPQCELFFLDLRSYRGPNGPNRQPVSGPETDYLGRTQLAWLKESLVASTATWKFVCSDMPLGLLVRDGADAFENGANGDGIPLGRELEVASLLRHLRDHRVRNVVWLTADVHYCASHFYDPARAQFTEFDGFWEFVSGPLHAGTFGPGTLDDTFGPQVRFSSRKPGDAVSGPWSDQQFFGSVRIAPESGVATVAHFNREGRRLWSIDLEPARS